MPRSASGATEHPVHRKGRGCSGSPHLPIASSGAPLNRPTARSHLRPLLWLLLGFAVLGALLHAAWVGGLGAGELDGFVDEWVYNAVLALAAAVCLLRALEPTAERWIWLAFGLGLAAWTAGDIYWTVALADVKHPPYPSLADVGYLLAYPCLYVGVLLLVRRRVRLSTGAWLDGAIGGLAAAALATAALSPALIGLTKGDPSVVATNLAYPLGDILLLSFLLGGLAAEGLRAGRSWLLVGAGLVAWGIADPIYLYQQATGTYDGGYLDSLWLIGGIAIAAAAIVPESESRERRQSHSMFFPALFSAVAVGVLAWDHYDTLNEIAIWLAVATLGVVVLRLVVTFRENQSLLGAVRHEAVTDPLTALHNRRSLMTELERVAKGPREMVFAIFDLDGFKAYNDSFGHPAGDMLLRRCGEQLAASVAPQGKAFRLGGDEFCVLVPGGRERLEGVLAIAGAALSERGEGLTITASAGGVMLPTEATDPTEALRTADMRMYAAKGLRATSAQRQTQDVLVRVLREREPALGDHLRGVARLAAAIGKAARLDAEQLDSLVRAAELHDIGKIAIPDRILHKRGPLDEADWDLMRTHTTIGERILSAAPAMNPVAEVVRSSHERWDGGGYPDGLAGDESPLGSRIIFVCDAFEAMTEQRSYREVMSPTEALGELRRCAGTQFDPALVDLFAERVFPRLELDLADEPMFGPRTAGASSGPRPAAEPAR
jgi:two-component system cell cycle response regulator